MERWRAPARRVLTSANTSVRERDHVDLALARADVARQHAKAEPLQVRRGELLAESTQRSPRVTGRSGALLRRGGPVGGQGAITLQIAWEAL